MTESKQKKPLKILCVDDESEILNLFSDFIPSIGFEVLKASNVDQALEILKKESGRMALILSDYSMEGKSGFDLRRESLEEFKHIPFILISGHISREDALKAVELKISAFVEKPFKPEELQKLIEKESKDRVSSIRDDDEMLAGFIVDATAMVEEIEGLLLSLEENHGDIEAINRIFACAHTIKGASGFFRPDTVHKFTHKYEDFLSQFKKEPERLDSNGVGVLLKGLDTIKNLLGQLESGEHEEVSLENLTAIFKVASQVDLVSEPDHEKGKKLEKANAAQAAQQAKKTDEIRVSIALLNDFMEKSGEITVLRNMINKVLRAIEVGSPSDPNVSALSELLTEMHKVIASMQNQLEDLRKVPVKQVFKPLGRTLRDLCVGLKKQITLDTEGDDLRIDHTLAETLNKCLVHMLRNSADHGIESQDQRVAAGKTPNGKISISCSEASEEILIKISDDGRGIDPAKIRSKAVEKGLVSEVEASKLPDASIRMLIFEPGFSTAEAVTDVSGRGVGTDMVKTTINSMGGRIQLDSDIGKGTTFSLYLPIPKSVLIINSLMVRIDGHIFAIPQDKIVRVLRLKKDEKEQQIMSIGDALFIQDSGKLIPMIQLEDVLSLGMSSSEKNSDSVEAVLVQSKNGNYCIQVDAILDSEEIVVKKSGKWFGKINCYMGATFLGDGKIGLILDADGIGEKSNLKMHLQTDASSKLNEYQKNNIKKNSFLLFEAGDKSKYAVRQSEVFRLEELKKSQIQQIGDQIVTIYREQTVPVIEVQKILGLKNIENHAGDHALIQKDTISTIITQSKGKFFAFSVEKIGDFVNQEVEEEKSNEGNSKTRIIQGQVVTLVELDTLLEKAA